MKKYLITGYSFNHIGPFQRDIFVISSFAKQLVEIKKSGRNSGELVTGDTSIVRDFTDVRDVVVAYDLLLKKGKPGGIYNVCSGKGASLNDFIGIMAKILDLNIHIRVNEKLVRPSDNRIIIGSNEKIRSEVGWGTTISLEQSLADIINSWCKEYTH